ncbi:glycosyltransferase [Acinetobacter rongchengensis]|uniref:Glycosyltransferase n=1 Tax=Acinetobacter rongchengensis TaxID=2419601 RepID=A0A3A8FBJ7_9GAMM|nr:glycosyltransferase [Acinetobacter rongchengensis]
MDELAPIALFVYNRPEHTKRTIDALKNNTLANQSELFIFSDWAKNDENIKDVETVREYLKTITGFKKITIIEREYNWGLAQSIIDGVTNIINKYNKIIVVEDDLLTSPYFLYFMNDALSFYKDKAKVWHISGWNYPIDSAELGEFFFWNTMNCWGWATWKSRWENFEKNPERLIKEWSEVQIKQFDLDNSGIFWSQILANMEGKIDTWAIFWYATIFEHNGLCLNPTQTFVKNFGHDGTGTNCTKENTYLEGELNLKRINIRSNEIFSSKEATALIRNYYNNTISRDVLRNLIKKIRISIGRKLGRK